jgi:hypothetical protein
MEASSSSSSSQSSKNLGGAGGGSLDWARVSTSPTNSGAAGAAKLARQACGRRPEVF